MKEKSTMLDNAIVDAEALLETAKHQAQQTILQNHSEDVKMVINRILAEEMSEEDLFSDLEGREEEMDMLGEPDSMMGGMEGSPESGEEEEYDLTSSEEDTLSEIPGKIDMDSSGDLEEFGDDDIITIDLEDLVSDEVEGSSEELEDEVMPDEENIFEEDDELAVLSEEDLAILEKCKNDILKEIEGEEDEDEEELELDEELEVDLASYKNNQDIRYTNGELGMNNPTRKEEGDLQDALKQDNHDDDEPLEKDKINRYHMVAIQEAVQPILRQVSLQNKKIHKLQKNLQTLTQKNKKLKALVERSSLINTKLVHITNVLKDNSLNEQQKIKIVESIETCKNKESVELVFQTFKKVGIDLFSKTKPQTLNEIAGKNNSHNILSSINNNRNKIKKDKEDPYKEIKEWNKMFIEG